MCPTCSRVLRVSCPTCCRALRASCPTCSRAVCAPFPTCFRASRASRASCPLVSYASRALLAICRTCLESDVPLAKQAPVSYVSYVLLYLTYFVPFVFSGCSWLDLYVLLCCSSFTCYLILTIWIHYIHYE